VTEMYLFLLITDQSTNYIHISFPNISPLVLRADWWQSTATKLNSFHHHQV